MMALNMNLHNISDVNYVEGITNHNHYIERALSNYCKQYFDRNYRGVFFAGCELKDEIFQEAFITLWENITERKIYVEDGILKGKDGKPFTGELTTYFMSIAKYKYMELVRDNIFKAASNTKEYSGIYVDMESISDYSVDEVRYDIIRYCISQMPKGCSQILTLFYYEEKNLDEIMMEMTTYDSKNALKTAKHKCMENLRNSANELFKQYMNN